MATSRRFALGLDFGTEAVRALLVDVASGAFAGRGDHAYAHGMMAERLLPDGPALPADFALQQPLDFLDGLTAAVAGALAAAQVEGGAIVGIGVDFTACTMLPVDASLTPLCWRDEFRNEPHAHVKLWKHHGAVAEAETINRVARELGEPWLARYGGTTSSSRSTMHQRSPPRRPASSRRATGSSRTSPAASCAAPAPPDTKVCGIGATGRPARSS
jgi:L-ribulokinase